MRDLLIYLLQNIADNKEAITVTETTDAVSIKNFQLAVAPSDMGKIIGKGGRIIKAIRDLTKVLATKQNIKANVTLLEN